MPIHSLAGRLTSTYAASRSVSARLESMLIGSLARFPWPITVRDWEGHYYTTGGAAPHWCGKPLHFHFTSAAAGRDALARNGLGVLEAFIRGEVDISGNLYVLTHLRDYVDVDLPWWRVLRSLTRDRLFQTISRATTNVRNHYDISQTALETYLDAGYMAYSCAIFERPGHFDAAELTRVGSGEADDFDSLEKAQWRKFKDALDFIAPSSRDTLLDVGCGYGGQLAVALKSYPFEKVVGCTHSSNQLVKGRTMLARFPADRWEINQRDYRQDDRVFSHITSTGMACHVGPRGLTAYVRNIRARITRGGRYVHHVLMTPYSTKPLDAEVGAAFCKRYVWPGFHWFTFGQHVAALEQNGFEVQKAVNLSAHYAKTAAAWYERMMANEQLMRTELGASTFRAWQIYLAGGSGSFLSRKSHIYRVYCVAV